MEARLEPSAERRAGGALVRSFGDATHGKARHRQQQSLVGMFFRLSCSVITRYGGGEESV